MNDLEKAASFLTDVQTWIAELATLLKVKLAVNKNDYYGRYTVSSGEIEIAEIDAHHTSVILRTYNSTTYAHNKEVFLRQAKENWTILKADHRRAVLKRRVDKAFDPMHDAESTCRTIAARLHSSYKVVPVVESQPIKLTFKLKGRPPIEVQVNPDNTILKDGEVIDKGEKGIILLQDKIAKEK
jgi:hypothetical protein